MKSFIELKRSSTKRLMSEWRKLRDKYVDQHAVAMRTLSEMKKLEQAIFREVDQPDTKYKDMVILEKVVDLPLDLESISNAEKIDLKKYQAKTIEKEIAILCE